MDPYTVGKLFQYVGIIRKVKRMGTGNFPGRMVPGMRVNSRRIKSKERVNLSGQIIKNMRELGYRIG